MNSRLSLMMVLILVGTNPTMAQTTLVTQLQHSEKVEADRLFNQGLQQYQENQYGSAITSWQSALKLYRRLRDRPGEAQTLLHQGKVSFALSRYGEALQLYSEALPIIRSLKNQDSESTLLLLQGNAYFALARYEEALQLYHQALSIAQAVQNHSEEANSLMSQANVYTSLLRYDEAIHTYGEALLIFQAVQDRRGEATVLLNLATTYRRSSRYKEALQYYNQALPIFQKLKNRILEAHTLLSRGIAYVSLSRYEEAMAGYNQALPIFQKLNARDHEANAWMNLGFAQFAVQQFSQAERSLRRAIAVFEQIRLDRLSEANKISVFETQTKSYRALQEVLIAQNQPETALTISEWGRTKALVERLTQQLQPSSQLISQAPSLATLTQTARSQNATLVEYSVIDDPKGQETRLFIWVIQPNGSIAFRQVNLAAVLPKQCPTISRLIGNSRDSIGVRSSQSDWLIVDAVTQKHPCTQSDPDENFTTLYKLLIEPIASLLPTDPNQHIVFIPDRTLFLVPLAALKSADGQFLIEKHTIRTAPSIRLLDKTRALKSLSSGQGALIVGNPFMPNDPNSAQPLSNLPNAAQEANAIAPLFGTQAITGKQGTKKTVLQQMSDARIIHLATHGSFDDRNGFKSWLALAPSETDNGILTAEEVAQLKLNADLVVLSACDTGRGKVTGDGVIGLSRSFISAGVPSVIVSLWAVPDAPTAELMQAFYQQLKHNADKAQALRQAMLTTLKTHPNPKNWAAFTLIGEGL
ncbi:TPR repeat-containing protein (plasmid) [Leptolyngbya boryana NIES-2135]|jgi:CHAT domain-containing protein|uniref:TPR repeat-containing protein n=1 Tax=Leptolyngbya boryana NIES-2135 TaxID=1973484 RepID=A0A1Z4JS14_LEPBY|nr:MULTISPECIES: CHAT domain-containing tetratricopeptide repeat protein [Leptolyngbya]BAY59512.1 TPR repeat-containing protein [Leptolyngbya boryana NIES-2135]MBD2373092.1 CHAT domain-containing protein [Leptolyngbya sp. FACHB-238]MBD2397153.1 CHAT domain-containing protein [Leptolyngbya sp. FACHB-239]MBD2404041.1 CHAT domain-containing protein [Leptolyngbya sp. FACHB-402]ULP33331.1 CHAT domain-containing tetratricopeptide repeat protein [Leptolyngbya boryana IU 594]